MLPDVLTNAGGVTVSYFEWVQDLGRLFWDRDEIRAKLAEKLDDAFDRVWELAEEREITLRSAALVAGIREVAGALDGAGDLPVRPRARRDGRRDPQTLDASATRAGGRGAARPARRARGATSATTAASSAWSTRKTLVREVVAAGRDPRDDAARRDRRAAALHARLRAAARRGVPLPRGARPRARAGARGRAARRRALAQRAAAAPGRGRAAARAGRRSSSRCRRPAARRPLRARAARRPRARRRGGCRARSPRARRARSGRAPPDDRRAGDDHRRPLRLEAGHRAPLRERERGEALELRLDRVARDPVAVDALRVVLRAELERGERRDRAGDADARSRLERRAAARARVARPQRRARRGRRVGVRGTARSAARSRRRGSCADAPSPTISSVEPPPMSSDERSGRELALAGDAAQRQLAPPPRPRAAGW